MFNEVTEYPFPRAFMIADLDGNLEFSTEPPTLRQLFLVILEMASWINLGSDDERNIILMHQSDLHTSTPTYTLACLIAFLNPDTLLDGAHDAVPFI